MQKNQGILFWGVHKLLIQHIMLLQPQLLLISEH